MKPLSQSGNQDWHSWSDDPATSYTNYRPYGAKE